MSIYIPIVLVAVVGIIVLAVKMHKEAMRHIAELQFFLHQKTIVQNQAKAKLAVMKSKYDGLEKDYRTLQMERKEINTLHEKNVQLIDQEVALQSLEKEIKMLQAEKNQYEKIEKEFHSLQSELAEFEKLAEENKKLQIEASHNHTELVRLEHENRLLRAEVSELEKLEKENQELKLEIIEKTNTIVQQSAVVNNTFLEKRRAQIDNQMDARVFMDYKKSRYSEERNSFQMIERKAEIDRLEKEIAAIQKILNGDIKEKLMFYMNEVDLLNQKLNSARKDFNSHLATRAFEGIDIKDVA